MTVLRYDPESLVVLGGAFAGCYWLADAVLAAARGVGKRPLLVLGVAMAVGWPLFVGYLSAVTSSGRGPVRRTAVRIALWMVVFGGVAIVVTWAFLALFESFWPGVAPTTFWFGLVWVSTAVLGAATVAGGSVYRVFAADNAVAPGE